MKFVLSILTIVSLFSCSDDSRRDEPEPRPVLQYVLTYNANGATSGTAPSTVTAYAGADITLSTGAGLSKNEYAFAGWNGNSIGTGPYYAAGSKYTLNGNDTLYAEWIATGNNNNTMKITVGNATFTAKLAVNTTAAAFKAILPITLDMSDFNNNEKVGVLPNSLSTAASNPGMIQTGDIMLYGSNSLVLFYETFHTPYSYSRIGQVDSPSALKAALGQGDVTIKFE